MSDRAETLACVKALKELLDAVENAEWTNPDMPSWEYEALITEATYNASKAIRLFDVATPSPKGASL